MASQTTELQRPPDGLLVPRHQPLLRALPTAESPVDDLILDGMIEHVHARGGERTERSQITCVKQHARTQDAGAADVVHRAGAKKASSSVFSVCSPGALLLRHTLLSSLA
eukprot:TRINITY_DN23034_c0_g1_i1.p2 TRINITY_DN23034_c0_g1~~TRINITY_DN23034_c0_g1_i1.p2  ORF type:complete len:110 (+),score=7.21 TRINITY_DN23034_c0_g1_i1:152-481(+)